MYPKIYGLFFPPVSIYYSMTKCLASVKIIFNQQCYIKTFVFYKVKNYKQLECPSVTEWLSELGTHTSEIGISSLEKHIIIEKCFKSSVKCIKDTYSYVLNITIEISYAKNYQAKELY